MSSSSDTAPQEHTTSSVDPVIQRNPEFVPAVEVWTDPQPPASGTFVDIRTGKIFLSLQNYEY
jgi:hypothetical protein